MPILASHVGYAIASHLDNSSAVSLSSLGPGAVDNVTSAEPSMEDQWFQVSAVDTTDPSNLMVGCEDGSIFRVSIQQIA